MSKKPLVLCIMDGYGHSENQIGNAVYTAKTPKIEEYMNKYPHTMIDASGNSVGLPDGQMGNSEVGHTNIGAGRVVYQELTRITKAIDEGDFFKNPELVKSMTNAKDNALHILGLVSDGGVHSHIYHLKALLKMAKEYGVKNVYLHAFTDGRDTDPQSGLGYLKDVKDTMDQLGVGKIASISGRYYAMDRDARWERVQRAYDAIMDGKGNFAVDPLKAVEDSYNEEITDEFIEPLVVIDESMKPIAKVEQGDSVVFFNFRPDRARELTRAISQENFNEFEKTHKATLYTCMTEYDNSLKGVDVAFKPQILVNTIGQFLANHNMKQLRAAETEKYAHVTFFFNGGVEKPYTGEDRILIPSPKVPTYDLQPEMSAYLLTDAILEKLEDNPYDVIILNFANPDMVGHTGVMEATVKAVEVVDECVGKIFDRVLELGGSGIITADHGNAEYMIDKENGKVITSHSTNLVPYIVLGKEYVGRELVEGGKLSDIAPTMLDMLGMDQPDEMTGHSLIKK